MKNYLLLSFLFLGLVAFTPPKKKELKNHIVEREDVCDLGTKVYVQNSDTTNRYEVTVKWKNDDIQGTGNFVVYVKAGGRAYAGCTYIVGDKSGHRTYTVKSEKTY